jgi:hypothetical protein
MHACSISFVCWFYDFQFHVLFSGLLKLPLDTSKATITNKVLLGALIKKHSISTFWRGFCCTQRTVSMFCKLIFYTLFCTVAWVKDWQCPAGKNYNWHAGPMFTGLMGSNHKVTTIVNVSDLAAFNNKRANDSAQPFFFQSSQSGHNLLDHTMYLEQCMG